MDRIKYCCARSPQRLTDWNLDWASISESILLDTFASTKDTLFIQITIIPPFLRLLSANVVSGMLWLYATSVRTTNRVLSSTSKVVNVDWAMHVWNVFTIVDRFNGITASDKGFTQTREDFGDEHDTADYTTTNDKTETKPLCLSGTDGFVIRYVTDIIVHVNGKALDWLAQERTTCFHESALNAMNSEIETFIIVHIQTDKWENRRWQNFWFQAETFVCNISSSVWTTVETQVFCEEVYESFEETVSSGRGTACVNIVETHKLMVYLFVAGILDVSRSVHTAIP